MKLSMESYVLRKRFGDFEGSRMAKDAGFDCIDMSYYWTEPDSLLLGDGYREYAWKLRRHLDEIGLVCNQAHAPFGMKYGGEFTLTNKDYLAVVRSMESASLLGAGVIVVHAIHNSEDPNAGFPWEYNLAYYKSLQPYCEEFGVSIAVENLFYQDKKRNCYRGILGTPDELCRFVRALDASCFVACVDVGHAALVGSEPEDFCAQMDGTLLKAVHIQDGDYRSDRHTLPYFGKFNWEAIMRALKKVNYEGEITFEIFNYLKSIPTELVPGALSFAVQTGKHLCAIFEGA